MCGFIYFKQIVLNLFNISNVFHVKILYPNSEMKNIFNPILFS